MKKYFLRHTKVERIYKQQNHTTGNVTGSPSGRNERTLDHNSNQYEEIKYTGEGSYTYKYKSQH